MSAPLFPKRDMRQALLEALPDNDQTSFVPARTPKFTYVPPSHALALDPENTIVEGMRGAGKSHWWASLNSEEHRKYLESVFPETASVATLKFRRLRSGRVSKPGLARTL